MARHAQANDDSHDGPNGAGAYGERADVRGGSHRRGPMRSARADVAKGASRRVQANPEAQANRQTQANHEARANRQAQANRGTRANREAQASRQTQANHEDQVDRAAASASAMMRSYAASRSGKGPHSASAAGTGQPEGRGAQRPARERRPGASARRVQEPAKERGTTTILDFIAGNAVYIVSVAAVVALVTLMLFVVKSCVPTEVYDFDGELDFEYKSPYEENDFYMTAEGRYEYGEGDEPSSRTGIDVSENQDDIDWEAVAADDIDFAMIRLGYRGATEGGLFVDSRFSENLKGAKAAGIDCGVYFFSQAKNEKEAREEAEFIVKNLDGTKLEYPVAFDFESAVPGVDVPRASGLDKDEMSAIAEAFCASIERAGYHAMIYGNYYDLNLYHYDSLADKEVWWAEYNVSQPNPHLDIAMWQYASEGWVNGVSTPVDMNLDLSQVSNG